MAVMVDGSTIVLTGTVGDLYWDDSFTSGDVVMALAQVGRDQDITVRLNSGGGIATEGAAIHAAFVGHKGKVVIVVEGVAASAASVIAMAGDEIVMSAGAVMMIHDPSGVTFGTVADHELSIRALTALANAMAGIYAEKAGKTVEEARADMQAELWLTPEQAVEAGYADRLQIRAANDDAPVEPTAFDFRLYGHPPERLVALADQHAWSRRTRHTAALPAPRPKDTNMTTAPAPAAPPAVPATSIARSEASEIAKLCLDGGVPTMITALLTEGVTLAVAKERIGAAGQIKELVALARKTNPAIAEGEADTYLAAGQTVEQVRADLFNKMVAKQESTEVRSHIAPATGGPGATATMSSMEREVLRSGLKKDA